MIKVWDCMTCSGILVILLNKNGRRPGCGTTVVFKRLAVAHSSTSYYTKAQCTLLR